MFFFSDPAVGNLDTCNDPSFPNNHFSLTIMPASCAANNCVVRYKKGVGVKFHRFPKNQIMRNKWVIAIGRKDYNPSSTAVICSNHFKEEDYYINPFSTKVLKKEAIPWVFNIPKKINSQILTSNATEASLSSDEGSEELYFEDQESILSTSQASRTPVEQELILSNSQATQTPIQVFLDSNSDVISTYSIPLKSEENARRS